MLRSNAATRPNGTSRRMHHAVPPKRSRALPPLALALIPIFLLGGVALLPRVRGNSRLSLSFAAACGGLLAFWAVLRFVTARRGRKLAYDFVPAKVHYVQLFMHASIYAYWGWYWREVYGYVPLILAQVLFLYALDMLICWSRRDKWILGFGPIPIVLSTNLFLWFRDDWFFYQFLLVGLGAVCKEFIRWDREGERRHIFNPSAIALFVFSIALLVTRNTPLTWGMEIATTLHRPPHIYVEVFLLGIIVQGLFSVTLVTLSAAAVLYILNLAYTQTTGVYHFIDSNIPVSVFIGLHLLVTDPATSPRRYLGKFIFGGLYGAGVFALYALLGALGAPQFYDKLLCVPLLNLSVRALDRFSDRTSLRLPLLHPIAGWSGRRMNFAHMGVWCALFGLMLTTGFVGHSHPGQTIDFWRTACAEKRVRACWAYDRTLNVSCNDNSAEACLEEGRVRLEGKLLPGDAAEAGKSLGRACDLGSNMGCVELATFVSVDHGADTLRHACEAGDGAPCFMLGSFYHTGNGVPRDDATALKLFQQSCASGWWRGCGRLGESYMWGEGAPVDLPRALQSFDKACAGKYGPGCFNAGLMYARGKGTAVNVVLAQQRLVKACEFGVAAACQAPPLTGVASSGGRAPGAAQ